MWVFIGPTNSIINLEKRCMRNVLISFLSLKSDQTKHPKKTCIQFIYKLRTNYVQITYKPTTTKIRTGKLHWLCCGSSLSISSVESSTYRETSLVLLWQFLVSSVESSTYRYNSYIKRTTGNKVRNSRIVWIHCFQETLSWTCMGRGHRKRSGSSIHEFHFLFFVFFKILDGYGIRILIKYLN